MKKNEKGFTLIELLAVIVILAIIALIATPIVMNVINQSRKKAAEDSTYGVIEAVKTYHTEKMLVTNEDVSDTFYIEWTTSGGTTTIKGGVSSTSTATISDFKLSGTRPQSGSITINNDGTITVDTLKINGYNCSSLAKETDTTPTAGANIICKNAK